MHGGAARHFVLVRSRTTCATTGTHAIQSLVHILAVWVSPDLKVLLEESHPLRNTLRTLRSSVVVLAQDVGSQPSEMVIATLHRIGASSTTFRR